MKAARARRRIVGLVTIAAVLSVDAAVSAPSRKTFRAETEGSPHATVVGAWDEDDPSASNAARLSIDGGHALGRFTTFEASWITPASTSSRRPEMRMSYEVVYRSAVGSGTRLIQAVRARFPGGRWGRWVRHPIVLRAEGTPSSGAAGVVVPLTEPNRVIFQWKLTGKLSSPAAITGDFDLSVS